MLIGPKAGLAEQVRGLELTETELQGPDTGQVVFDDNAAEIVSQQEEVDRNLKQSCCVMNFMNYFRRVLSPKGRRRRATTGDKLQNKGYDGSTSTSTTSQGDFAQSTASTSASTLSSVSDQSDRIDESEQELLSVLESLRASCAEEKRMLLLEGEYKSQAVFVRDILFDKSEDLDPKALDRLLQAALELKHPYINNVLFARRMGDRIVLLSERAQESVQDKIVKSRSICFEETLTIEDALEIAICVSTAASFLHARGIQRLAIRPTSILVFPNKQYKLAESCFSPLLAGASSAKHESEKKPRTSNLADEDRGLCSRLRSVASNEELNSRTYPLRRSDMVDAFFPHPEYLAPEVLCGAKNVNEKADVFSFGMLLWQLLHLKRAYPVEWGPMMILQALQAGNRPHIDTSIVGMDSPLRRIIQLCWASDASRRPSFSEISAMLFVTKQSLFITNFDSVPFKTTMLNEVPEPDAFETPAQSQFNDGDSNTCNPTCSAAANPQQDVNHEKGHNTKTSVLDFFQVGQEVFGWSSEMREFFHGTVKNVRPDHSVSEDLGSLTAGLQVPEKKPTVSVLVHPEAASTRAPLVERNIIHVHRQEIVCLANKDSYFGLSNNLDQQNFVKAA